MTTWQDVVRTHLDHPDWTAPEIAARLGCNPAYVRATAQRRKLELVKAIASSTTRVGVKTEILRKLRKGRESPKRCLRRIVDAAIAAALAP